MLATGLLQEMSYTLFRHTAFYTGKSRLATCLDRDMFVCRLVDKCMWAVISSWAVANTQFVWILLCLWVWAIAGEMYSLWVAAT